ncbi:RNA-splicing factor [Arachnomyces sp. PD_36]|nr:RNA-splicing factor [Arachnomyces sp. PD_36]
MSSNVGLTTPRGSGTSGYVQRNISYLKPRDSGFGAPYPPRDSTSGGGPGGFKQRKPDKQILEHDRRREIEVKCLEERDRLEEENERVEKEEGAKGKDGEEGKKKVLSDEEIEERVGELRERLTREFERGVDGGGASGVDRRKGGGGRDEKGKGKRQFKAYQVHELAEAKIEESERLRRALGIREGFEREDVGGGRYDGSRDRDRERERDERR